MARHTLVTNLDDSDFDRALELCHLLKESRGGMLRKLIHVAHKELLHGPRRAEEAQVKASGDAAALKALYTRINGEIRAARSAPRELSFAEQGAQRRKARAAFMYEGHDLASNFPGGNPPGSASESVQLGHDNDEE